MQQAEITIDNNMSSIAGVEMGGEESSDRELALISDTNMWVREKAETRGLNITINPSTESESPGSSWTPLLHNLSTESIL